MENEMDNNNLNALTGANPKPSAEAVSNVARDGSNKSLWQENIAEISSDETGLAPNTVYDTLIVGAGITGVTTALLLQKAGKKCIIAEAHHTGFGTTGGTSAHINTFADTTFAETEKAFDFKSSQLFAKSIAESVALIHKNVTDYNIGCDFEWKKGFVYAETDKEVSELDDLYQSAIRVNVKASETSDVPTQVPYKKAVVFEDQAQFHPLKYLAGLQKEFIALGGNIVENTLIDRIETRSDCHLAKSQSVEIKAKYVIYATHIPPGGINMLHLRCAPYRSYVIAATLKDNNYPDDLVYDMHDPYHYFRTHIVDGQKYLVAGGNDHKTGHGDPEKSFEDLETYVNHYYQIDKIAYKWSAQYYVPADGLPYIGRLPGAADGIFTATGFNGNGMILGTVAAKVLSDLVLNNTNEYTDLFDPRRIKPIAGFTEIVKENVDVAYHFIADRFSTGEISSLAELQNDSGAVVQYKNQKLAIYKDISGGIHALNPICPHAKCTVQWNNFEKSWDCPCHGARYDKDGNVLTGPARDNLNKINLTGKV